MIPIDDLMITSLSSDDSQEIVLGLVSPEQMEQFHNIVPMANPTRRRNPAIFNPLKVCANMVLTARPIVSISSV